MIQASESKRLVFISLERWDEVWRRNQFVCRELAGRGWEILFVEPAADWSAGIRRRDWSQFARREAWSPAGLREIRVVRPVKVLPKSIRSLQAMNAGLRERCVSRHLVDWPRAGTVLWINDQQTWRLAKAGGWKRVVYDVTDDWSTGFPTGRTRNQIESDDQTLCGLADTVVVCSDRLYDLKESMADRVHLIPNGVDLATYRRVGVDTPPAAARCWKGPVLGYTGTIHPGRFDVDLMAEIALGWPGTVALVGPNHLGRAGDKLCGMANVVFVGPVAHETLPSWMSAMDVMIVPHKVDVFTESLNPLKLWEYLASGRPIVSTPVAGFRAYAEHVSLAKDAHEFLSSCVRLLDEPRQFGIARRSAAAGHSWASRVDAVELALSEPV